MDNVEQKTDLSRVDIRRMTLPALLLGEWRQIRADVEETVTRIQQGLGGGPG